jgi:hypothetical protein
MTCSISASSILDSIPAMDAVVTTKLGLVLTDSQDEKGRSKVGRHYYRSFLSLSVVDCVA